MHNRRVLTALLISSQILSFLALQPAARGDSWKDVEDLTEMIKSTGTLVQKTGECDGETLGYYVPPREDDSGDRLVLCTNNLDMEDVSAVWEVLSHESAHVIQACQGGLIWKEEFHPRILRNLKNLAPHYYEILQEYRSGDMLVELEAFDMELKTASEVKEIFFATCNSNDGKRDKTPQNQYEDLEDRDNIVNSTFAIVGGKASFKALMDWAAQNLSQEQMQHLEQVLKSGDITQIRKLLLELQRQFVESKSYEGYMLF